MLTHLRTHLRSNVVGYLALVIALGGTSYAAGLANGSVTTKKLAAHAVTTPKIKKNAVTSTTIRPRTITGSDLAVGLVPKDGFVLPITRNSQQPTPSPDVPDVAAQTVDLPRAGRAHVRAFSGTTFVSCTSGVGHLGVYVDGAPVPATRVFAPASGSAAAVEMQASLILSAGEHELAVGIDCPTGLFAAGNFQGSVTWTVSLAAS